MKIREWVSLFLLRFSLFGKAVVEEVFIVFRYYLRDRRFCWIDLYLLRKSFFRSPFTVSKRFLQTKGEKQIYAYGETPLTTGEQMVKAVLLKPDDVFFELGMGRGRFLFWVHAFVGCRCIGIEWIPEFVNHAETVINKFQLNNIDVRNEDFLTTDFSDATVIYLYGTLLEEKEIHQLIERFSRLKSGTKIITVSYSLNEFCQEPLFHLKKNLSVAFPWGKTEVFLQTVQERF